MLLTKLPVAGPPQSSWWAASEHQQLLHKFSQRSLELGRNGSPQWGRAKAGNGK
jgi:hypothetical protein